MGRLSSPPTGTEVVRCTFVAPDTEGKSEGEGRGREVRGVRDGKQRLGGVRLGEESDGWSAYPLNMHCR